MIGTLNLRRAVQTLFDRLISRQDSSFVQWLLQRLLASLRSSLSELAGLSRKAIGAPSRRNSYELGRFGLSAARGDTVDYISSAIWTSIFLPQPDRPHHKATGMLGTA
jgi:hypothetical protein